jgi:PAS domain S-box-containing protein
MKQLWRSYKAYVDLVMQRETQSELKDINYWRNRMFKNFILFSLPVSLFALIPAIPISINEGHPYLITFDVVIVTSIATIALNRRIKLTVRKAFVTLLFYLFAVVTIGNLGSVGPGVMYLLATTVISTLIFSVKLGYLSVILHLVTTSIFAFVIHMKSFNTPLNQQFTVGSWGAFSLNLIFLGLICVVLISKIINGLEGTIIQEVKLQNKLKESEDHYKSLFIQNPSPMWVVDAESHQFLQVNEVAVESYGYTKEEFLNMKVQGLRLACDAACLSKNFSDQIKPGKRYHYVTRHLRKDKKVIDVEVSCNAITVDGKQAVLAIGRDITKQQKYIQEIEEQNDKLLEIAYIQSHVVRAPLASIMGLINLIKMNIHEKPDPKVVTHLEASAKEFDLIIRRITDHTKRSKFDNSAIT